METNATVTTSAAASLDVGLMPTMFPSGAMTTVSDPCRSSVPPSQHDPGSCTHEPADRMGKAFVLKGT